MRNFAYKNPDYINAEFVPELIEGHPCYQQSVYDAVMYDESLDGDLIQVDMTQILLNQEKYRRLLGDMNVQNILAQMHPTQSTVMDDMTDEERFACVISRHCQTMSGNDTIKPFVIGHTIHNGRLSRVHLGKNVLNIHITKQTTILLLIKENLRHISLN